MEPMAARPDPPRGRRRAALVALAGAAGALALVAVAPALDAGESGARELRPDLVVLVPYDLEVTRAGDRWRLGFASAASNIGSGPLVVQGRRRPGAPTMAAVQELRRSDGSVRGVPGAGRLRYVTSPDHAHWHLTPFMRYELRPVGAPAARPLRDRKTGFCLGDRYDTKLDLPGRAPKRVFNSRCGLRDPGRLGLRQGISVGWGDDYDPTLEGQFVDVTGLAPGRYVLVHRVNESGALVEARTDNNASSLLVRLDVVGGRPVVRPLQGCPGRETC